MTHGSLFSGIGGFDLAAEWMGWENVFQCEINSFCQNILRKRFKTELYEDIRKFKAGKYRNSIDIVSGGFPCQPVSNQGERLGSNDDRWLWPEMLRVVKEINPNWVICENVTGIISMGLEDCCADLESCGYEVQAFNISACAIGINQDRKRVWIVAHNNWRQQKKPYQRAVLYRQKSPLDAFKPEPISIRNRINNGFPKRMDECKRIGVLANAIVPQIAYEIFKAIEEFENL